MAGSAAVASCMELTPTHRDFDKPNWKQWSRQIMEWELPAVVAWTVWVVDTEGSRTWRE